MKVMKVSTSFFTIAKLLLIFSLQFFTNSCEAQDLYTYRAVDYKRSYKEPPIDVLKVAVDITKYLPNGYQKDGKKDYTIFIQKALDENRVVLFPDFPILINKNGLSVSSNSKLIFRYNSRLIMQPNSSQRFSILDITRKRNIQIYNPYLHGDKDLHLGNEGQWGMGINIISSNNIQIYEPIITDNWGDGIYLGNRSKGDNNNITILGGLLDNNRRNGISIISGSNVYIKNTYITNVFGTLPMAAIDIEPNNTISKISNVNINNIKVFNCLVGLQVTLHNFGSKEINQKATVNITGLNVQNSSKGVYVTGLPGNVKFKQIKGLISFDGLHTYKVTKPFLIENNYQTYPSIRIKNYSFNIDGTVHKNDIRTLLKNVAVPTDVISDK